MAAGAGVLPPPPPAPPPYLGFGFELIPDASIPAELRAVSPDSESFVWIQDPRVCQLLPSLPSALLTYPPNGTVTVVGREWLQLVLDDHIVVPMDLLPASPTYQLLATRWGVAVYQRIFLAAVYAGLPMRPYSDLGEFSAVVRRVLQTLDAPPTLMASDFETGLLIDYALPANRAIAFTRFVQEISLQDFRVAGNWMDGLGFLRFSFTPSWEVDQRVDENGIFVSLASQWSMLLESNSDPASKFIRSGIRTSKAIEIFRRGWVWKDAIKALSKNIDRELEFLKVLSLGSKDRSLVERGFSDKILEIVTNVPHMEPLRQIMHRTRDKEQLISWIKQISTTFKQSVDSYFTFDGSRDLCEFLAKKGRLDFASLPQYNKYSDKQFVEHLLNVKIQVVEDNSGTLPKADSSSLEASAGERVNVSAADLEAFHLSVDFLNAKAHIMPVVCSPEAEWFTVIKAVLETGVPWLCQYIVGKPISLRGDELYSKLAEYVCVWGETPDVGNVESRVGAIMGRVAMEGHLKEVIGPDNTLRGFTFARSQAIDSAKGKVFDKAQPNIVMPWLKGKLVDYNFENLILGTLVHAESGGVSPTVSEADRFMNYQKVDELIDAVAPITALFGCGSDGDPDSFHSVMKECKLHLRETRGFSEHILHDQLYGEPNGLRPFILNCLGSASERLRLIFQTRKGPAVMAHRGFMMPPPHYFKLALAEGRKGNQMLRVAQKTFKSTFDKFTGGEGQLACEPPA